jgi:hypothetical protein
MGPGRWGSRGDIRLGVSVTYADISNTAILAEVARRKGSYVPDLSFGTHFFQDLVEAEIRYLPLYPDEPGNRVQRGVLPGAARNLLPELLPDFAHLADTVRVMDVPAETGGLALRVCMNGELDEAMGYLVDPEERRNNTFILRNGGELAQNTGNPRLRHRPSGRLGAETHQGKSLMPATVPAPAQRPRDCAPPRSSVLSSPLVLAAACAPAGWESPEPPGTRGTRSGGLRGRVGGRGRGPGGRRGAAG